MTNVSSDSPQPEPEQQPRRSSKGNGAEPLTPAVPAGGPVISPLPERTPYNDLLAALRGGDDEDTTPIKPLEIRYECRKPRKKKEFIRTHPDLPLWLGGYVLIDEEGMDKTVYLVAPAMRELLEDYISPV